LKDKKDKQIQADLGKQAAQNQQLFLDAYNKANAPDPLEERRRASSLAFLDSVEGKNGPFDVTKTPGMEPFLSLYDHAKAGQAADANTDTGLFQLGSKGGSPELVARMKEQNAMRQQERASGDLSDAFAGKYAEVTGNTIPFLLQYKQQRDLNLADMMSGKSTASTGMWANFKPGDSIWSKLWQNAAKGAGAAAAAGGG
jgi:hypothetical protein